MNTKRVKRLPKHIGAIDDLLTQDSIKNCIEDYVLKGLPSVDGIIVIKRNVEGYITLGVAGFETIEVLGALDIVKNMVLTKHNKAEESE